MATYSCDAGYGLVGDLTRTCDSADTWSGTEPTCESENDVYIYLYMYLKYHRSGYFHGTLFSLLLAVVVLQ